MDIVISSENLCLYKVGKKKEEKKEKRKKRKRKKERKENGKKKEKKKEKGDQRKNEEQCLDEFIFSGYYINCSFTNMNVMSQSFFDYIRIEIPKE